MTTSEDALLPLSADVEKTLLDGQQRFLRFLEGRVGNRATAEEILQAAYVKVFEKGFPEGDTESAVRWFYAILRNALIDHHRRAGTESKALREQAAQPGSRSVDPELESTICACMNDLLPMLKPEYADVVRRVDLEERPVAEVAREVGITPNNAAVRLHRARAALKKQLERSCGSCATHGCLDCSCGKSKKVDLGDTPRD